MTNVANSYRFTLSLWMNIKSFYQGLFLLRIRFRNTVANPAEIIATAQSEVGGCL